MSTSLADFYAHMKPFLTGARDLARTREALGPSPSGDDDFAFYRVLAVRNVFRVMREIYGPLRTLVQRDEPKLWNSLVRQYVRAHPSGDPNPNGVGEWFSDYLAERREREPEQPVVYEELADFCWVRQSVYAAPGGHDDGFERRLYVRQYSYRIHDVAAALEREEPSVDIEPRPTLLLIYRHWRSLETRLFQPSAAGLVALARRQDMEVPEALRSISEEHVAQAIEHLVGHGVLAPSATG